MGFNELEEIITSSDKFSEDFKSKLKKLGQVAALSGAIMAGSMGLTGCPSPNQSNPLPQITSIEIVDEVPNSDAQITYDYQNGFSGKIKASFDIGEPTEININNGMVSNILGIPAISSNEEFSQKSLKELYGLDREIYEDSTFDITINYGGKTTTAKVKNNISYKESFLFQDTILEGYSDLYVLDIKGIIYHNCIVTEKDKGVRELAFFNNESEIAPVAWLFIKKNVN